MPLDVIQEKNLSEVIDYALEYPSMVLATTKSQTARNLAEYSFGVYVGYISGVFFDKFLTENKRFLNDDEMLHFNLMLKTREPEILMKVKTHLRL